MANCLALLLQTAQAAEPVAPAAIFTAKTQLGRMIFFDTRLSEPSGQACATCHAPERAFSGIKQEAVSKSKCNNVKFIRPVSLKVKSAFRKEKLGWAFPV